MVMALSLLVHSPSERKLSMKKKGVTTPHQAGKATDTPTTRGVFRIFEYFP